MLVERGDWAGRPAESGEETEWGQWVLGWCEDSRTASMRDRQKDGVTGDGRQI